MENFRSYELKDAEIEFFEQLYCSKYPYKKNADSEEVARVNNGIAEDLENTLKTQLDSIYTDKKTQELQPNNTNIV
ncbi:uncharacterized protein ASCRUDRAFT_76716, partial [Ascoidea rubescens DSM 1968]